MINWLGSQDRQTRFNAPPAFTTAYVRVPRYEARPLTKHGRIKVHNLNLRGRGAVELSLVWIHIRSSSLTRFDRVVR